MIFKSILCSLIISQFVFAGDSGVSGAFTDVGYSVKSISMGSVQSTLNQGAMSSFLNPASLSHQKAKHSLYLNSFKHMGIFNYMVFAYSTSIYRDIPLGIMIISSGDKAWSENQIGLSAGHRGLIDGLSLGITFKMLLTSFGNNEDGSLIIDGVEQQITGSGLGFALNGGAQFKFAENQQIALVVKNLISSVGYNSKGGGEDSEGNNYATGNYSEAIPAQYTLGYRISNESSTVLFDIVDVVSGNNPAEIRLGSEWKIDWFNLKKDIVNLRFGYRSELMSGDNAIYSFGTGFNYEQNISGTGLLLLLYVDRIGLNLGYLVRPGWNDMSELRFEIKFDFN